ncbi:hypothetical protein AJ80_08760 [Polytolypa hystricis UAMH7299]|uniref:Mediator of RNA polymerase II transcription subunit 6 n=1 Tax=Polytolypa hystricis (strain UAMH7299) TaxID=1447883 RepID=A0A2B7X2B5_POLH7|nr:hypothetical protein AJ80_08760 [Polytolypa hystricis UAMH7299]
MAGQGDVPLGEITWRSPQHVQMMGGFLHSNNILFYFAESPFFDPTSNNASLAIQASYNENFRAFVETREAFEARLKTMQGLEFMVAHDPLQEAAAAAAAQKKGQPQTAPSEPSNIWVIRRQMRRKRTGTAEDEVQILATYFVLGDSIFMAPSVFGVLGSRMLSTVTSLTNVLSAASPLPIFSPSHGHTYMPPVPKSLEGPQPGAASAQQSTANTPAPEALSGTSSSLTKPTGLTTSSFGSSNPENDRTLFDALNLLSHYGDEYMDETPLMGEPGSFIISKKTAAPAAESHPTATRQIAVKQPPSTASTPMPHGGSGKPGTPAAGTGGVPTPLRTDAATLAAAAGKPGGKSPTTPGGSAAKEKKRKKARVASGVGA